MTKRFVPTGDPIAARTYRKWRRREAIGELVVFVLFMMAMTAIAGIADLALHGGHGCTVDDIDVVAGPHCAPDGRADD
jgi:hypothetical protein